jgi:hypothetical protein
MENDFRRQMIADERRKGRVRGVGRKRRMIDDDDGEEEND